MKLSPPCNGHPPRSLVSPALFSVVQLMVHIIYALQYFVNFCVSTSSICENYKKCSSSNSLYIFIFRGVYFCLQMSAAVHLPPFLILINIRNDCF